MLASWKFAARGQRARRSPDHSMTICTERTTEFKIITSGDNLTGEVGGVDTEVTLSSQ